jgi:hypothetical protein
VDSANKYPAWVLAAEQRLMKIDADIAGFIVRGINPPAEGMSERTLAYKKVKLKSAGAEIYDMLSKGSKALVAANPDAGGSMAILYNAPLLWNIIKQTHDGSALSADARRIRVTRLLGELDDFQQSTSESFPEYKLRFHRLIVDCRAQKKKKKMRDHATPPSTPTGCLTEAEYERRRIAKAARGGRGGRGGGAGQASGGNRGGGNAGRGRGGGQTQAHGGGAMAVTLPDDQFNAWVNHQDERETN